MKTITEKMKIIDRIRKLLNQPKENVVAKGDWVALLLKFNGEDGGNIMFSSDDKLIHNIFMPTQESNKAIKLLSDNGFTIL